MANHSTVSQTDTREGLIQGLGLLDATTLVMGSMIGSGIFLVSADISRQVNSPGLLMLVWAAASLMTLIAALSYGELAAAMPRAGGQYVYLRESFGPLSGFLYGWTLFLVIQTGTVAAVAVAFAKFLGVLVPWVSPLNWVVKIGPVGINVQQAVAILVIILLTWVNTRGVRTGAIVQNTFTFAKVGSLLLLIALGIVAGRNPQAISENFDGFWRNTSWNWDTLRIAGVAMVGALFSVDAWNNVTFTAGEIRNPKRNLPLSLALGVGLVCLLYIGCNLIYLAALPLPAIQNAAEDRVGTAVVQGMLGTSAQQIMAVAIMISTFGCVNGLLLAGARVYYAMAQDRLFFRAVGRIDPAHHTPKVSLWVQCLWACLLTLTGRYSDLLDYVIFAVLLFYILTIAGLFVLRRRDPGMERPYKAIGYPILPALYLAMAVGIEILLLLYKPTFTWPGLIIVLLGIPVYFMWRQRGHEA